jgi:hypothetical protein
MSETTAERAPRDGGTRTPRRGGPPGRLVVGEYVGQLAADAAQAVRRSGLLPGLERSFGCDPELTGRVVAQEPAAGSDLARNGIVSLYVAAPGTDPDPSPEHQPQPMTPSASATHDSSAEPVPRSPASLRGRRKPGLSHGETRMFDPAPAPTLPAVDMATNDGEDLAEEPRDEAGQREPSDEQLMARASDVFAGRTDGTLTSQRAYAHNREAGVAASNGQVRGWLATHRRVAKTTGAMLVLSALLALAMLAGHRTHSHHGSPAQESTRHPVTATAKGGAALAARRASARAGVRVPRRSGRVTPGGAPQRGVQARTASDVAVSAGAGSAAPAPPASEGVGERAAAPQQQEQTQGGPFSP